MMKPLYRNHRVVGFITNVLFCWKSMEEQK